MLLSEFGLTRRGQDRTPLFCLECQPSSLPYPSSGTIACCVEGVDRSDMKKVIFNGGKKPRAAPRLVSRVKWTISEFPFSTVFNESWCTSIHMEMACTCTFIILACRSNKIPYERLSIAPGFHCGYLPCVGQRPLFKDPDFGQIIKDNINAIIASLNNSTI